MRTTAGSCSGRGGESSERGGRGAVLGGAGGPAGAGGAGALAAGSGRGVALTGDGLGRLTADSGARAWYCDRVVAALEGRDLGGVRVVIDCANGAATTTAAAIRPAAGADVVEVLAAAPDGVNINAGSGSTDPGVLAR